MIATSVIARKRSLFFVSVICHPENKLIIRKVTKKLVIWQLNSGGLISWAEQNQRYKLHFDAIHSFIQWIHDRNWACHRPMFIKVGMQFAMNSFENSYMKYFLLLYHGHHMESATNWTNTWFLIFTRVWTPVLLSNLSFVSSSFLSKHTQMLIFPVIWRFFHRHCIVRECAIFYLVTIQVHS